MKSLDVAVIGGGLLGCFTARSLCRYELKTLLIERQEDVCRGISRAKSAIVSHGYDNKPGSLKAQMTVRANAYFDRLCDELDVEFIRRGSLLLSYDEVCDRVLEKKLRHGLENGVPELQIVSGEKAMELEPKLSTMPRMALYCPGTGTVNPWQLGIAAYENAMQNGLEAMLGTSVLGIEKSNDSYIVKTDREEISCRAVINCAGLYADKVREMLFPPELRIYPDASDFLVFDKHAPRPEMILFEERPAGKALTLVPTVEGNLLLESSLRELESADFSFKAERRAELVAQARAITDTVSEDNIIRSFGAVRPNLRYVKKVGNEYVPSDKDISSFALDRPEPSFLSLMGIKTPGLSCANELGLYAARTMADYLSAGENRAFDPKRRGITRINKLSKQEREALISAEPDYADIICLCEGISRAEIKQAIARGARDVEGVKRRLGTSMGPCQGSRCNYAISKMLEVEK